MTVLRSLSFRLFLMTVVVVLATEVLVFLPGLAQERRAWLREHLRDADIASLAVAATPDAAIDQHTIEQLLRLSDAEMIQLSGPNGQMVALSTPNTAPPEFTVDLRSETILASFERAVHRLFAWDHPRLLIIGTSPRDPRTVLEVIVPGRPLADALRQFARTNVREWLVIAAITGALLYIALHALLVRPLRRMTGSMAAFRAAPERAPPADTGRSARAGDEISVATRELAAMQADMRTTLWRNARLAALGTAVAKVSHDLRGILSSAMLAADRLNAHADPVVRRSGDIVIRSVERATELVRQTLEFAREGPPPLSLIRCTLHSLIEEARESVPGLVVRNQVSPDLVAEVDRIALFRVLSNLMRNAQQAGASWVSVSAGTDGNAILILVADDGPGLPEGIQHNLFRAFSGSTQDGGSGLGLAIARDLMRAHGGDVVLDTTGPDGTIFRLLLPLPEGVEAAAK